MFRPASLGRSIAIEASRPRRHYSVNDKYDLKKFNGEHRSINKPIHVNDPKKFNPEHGRKWDPNNPGYEPRKVKCDPKNFQREEKPVYLYRTLLWNVKRQSEPLHLYRQLLRQASYLPDSFVRQWVREYIGHRFRSDFWTTHSYDTTATETQQDIGNDEALAQKVATREKRLRKGIIDARKGLSLLTRANYGDHDPLLRVFGIVYARSGPRRREMIQPLLPGATLDQRKSWLTQNVQSDNDDTESLLAGLDWKDRTVSKLFEKLGESQSSNHIKFRRTPMRRKKTAPLGLTSWFQELSQRQKMKNVSRYRREFLQKVLIPLPIKEFQRLQQLALGREVVVLPPKRSDQHKRSEHYERINALTAVVESNKLTLSKTFEGRHNEITRRKLRRLYKAVLDTCPVISWNAGSWTISWPAI